MAVPTRKDGRRLCGGRVLIAQREEVCHVLGLEEAPLPRILQHLQGQTNECESQHNWIGMASAWQLRC